MTSPAGRPVPPLIEAAPASRLIRLRDQLLTLAAWGVTALLVRNALALLWDFFRPPIFQLSKDQPEWDVVLEIVLRYQLELQILTLWILGWALLFSLHRRDVNRRDPTTPPVLRSELAGATGVPEATLLSMEEVKLIEVDIGEEARIVAVRPSAQPESVA